ncbi:Putative type II secretion system protein F [Pontiella desulfatans]|uniref:Type II secretion system protein F n=1 Tax=Pontiella desulfatans TaxID=2750659 RepID=A0A6C2U4C9_PONDE|nr:type II secretion system F family protein [Pontiella desulfatans]VGO14256.1 Putative type II secretion system protein F [Pontiella desulfatans]
MPRFFYRAVNAQGHSSTGAVEAADAAGARRKLRTDGLTPVDIRPANPADHAHAASREKSKPVTSAEMEKLNSAQVGAGEANKIALELFTRVHQLVDNGMPLGDAVKALGQRLTVPRQKALCSGLWHELSKGSNMAGAMRRFPKIFDATTIAMVEAGEATGNLGPILENLIEMLETRREMRKEIASGLAYPAFILIVVFLVMLFVLFYLMPNIQTMMDSMGGELTLPTRIVMGFAKFSLTGGPFILGAFGGIFLLFRQWRKTEGGRLASDRWLLRLPVVKGIAQNAELSRVCNLSAVLLDSGVDTTDALRLIERSMQNRYLRGLFSASRTLISDGASFANALRHNKVMPDMDLDILGISEDAGDLVAGFRSIYKARNEELRDQMKRLTVWIGTGAMFFVFALVFLLVFGIVSSILQLSSSVLG